MSSAEDWRGLKAEIERTATPRGRARIGCYAIEGTRLHERALRAGVPVQRALAARSLAEHPDRRVRRLLSELSASGCAVLYAPDGEIARLTDGREAGAIVGLAPLPSDPVWDDVPTGPHERVLVAVDVEDPGNVGALVRTALASGCAAFVACGRSDPWHPKAVRTSMGSLFKLPLFRREVGGDATEELRTRGFETLGAVARGGVPLPELAPAVRPRALFLGSEAFGLDDALTERLDLRVSIPMHEGVDSYSVNAAAAILLYALGQP